MCDFKREFSARHHRYTDAEKGAGAIAKAMRAKGYNISHEGVAGVLRTIGVSRQRVKGDLRPAVAGRKKPDCRR
jgi:hypothetical protein